MKTLILAVKVPDDYNSYLCDVWYRDGKISATHVHQSVKVEEIHLTPAELQAVITLITLNESDNIYANPLLAGAKEKLTMLK